MVANWRCKKGTFYCRRKDRRGFQSGPPPIPAILMKLPGNHITAGADRWPIRERPAQRFDGITTVGLMRKFCRPRMS